MNIKYNKELAIKASSAKLGIDKIKSTQTDSKGDVIRDYRSELDIYVKNEETYVLPDIDIKFFDGQRIFKKFNKRKDKNFKGEVKKIKLAPLPENKRKPSLIEYFVIILNHLYSKLQRPSKEGIQFQKGYYWIYNQMKTADSCKRKLAS